MTQSQPPAGAAISLRQTLATSKWLGVVCPKCGNTLAEGEQVVLCPKCYTPQHAQCWRDNGNQCALDQTPARIIERPGAASPAGARTPAATPAPGTADAGMATPTSTTPRQPTPSADTSPAAQGAPGVPASPPAAGAVRPEAAVQEARGLWRMDDVRKRLENALADFEPVFGIAVDEVTCAVPAARIREAARRAKDDEHLRFDYLRCLSGVDYQAEGIEVVYHLFSTRLLQKCVLKARVSGEGQSLPSVTSVWAGANWHERETAEMFNISFEGHPHPEPLLLQKDEEGRIVPGPILLKRFPLRPKEPPGIYGFPEED